MVDPNDNTDYEFLLDKEHQQRAAWLEANGMEEPIGCKNPLDILLQLEVVIEVEI
jgi:hypothetical protein